MQRVSSDGSTGEGVAGGRRPVVDDDADRAGPEAPSASEAPPDAHANGDGASPGTASTQEIDTRGGEQTAPVVVGGRYRLGERIGAGGMATIYRATDLTLERDVAVKVLHAHLADEPAVLQRFRTEAQHAAALAHAHVVSVFDQGGEDRPFIVMEYVDGPSLRELLRRRGRVTPQEALALLDPACRALHRAHELGMVHRDVKPENVLVTDEGVVKVADFGIARAIEGSQHTQTGALVGSVHYLAPELVDEEQATPASDQYAFGVVLFELLTGRKALPADSPVAVALRHAHEAVPPPSEFASDVTEELDAVVARACALDPDDRYPDLAALLTALHAAVPEGPRAVTVPTGEDDAADTTVVMPVSETPVPPSINADTSPVPWERRRRRRSPPTARRRALGLLAATVMLLVLATGGAAAAWHWLIAPIQQMPSLQGESLEEARETLDGYGLIPKVETSHSVNEPEGTVIGQDPQPGSELRRGSEVELVVSAGPAIVEVPDVVGWALGDARLELEDEPYFFSVVRVVEEYSDEVPEGQVTAQSLQPGDSVDQGAAIELTVSLGVQQVEVPDLAGLTREEAERRLQDAGLRGAFTEEYSDSVPTEGEVIEQSLEPGREIEVDTVVEVVVSRGPLTIEVPDLRNEPVDDAVAELERLDLDVHVVATPRSQIDRMFGRGEEGRVEEMDPEPGRSIERGDRIEVYTFDDDA